MEFTPGDAADMLLSADSSEEAREQVRQDLGLDKPFLERYINYIKNTINGEFGRSYRTGRPVFQEIWYRYPITLKLALTSIIMAIAIGVPIGVLSAVKQYSFLNTGSIQWEQGHSSWITGNRVARFTCLQMKTTI